jgi:hypothetical protein
MRDGTEDHTAPRTEDMDAGGNEPFDAEEEVCSDGILVNLLLTPTPECSQTPCNFGSELRPARQTTSDFIGWDHLKPWIS